MEMQSFAEILNANGWAVTDPVVPSEVLDDLTVLLTPLLADSARGGVRHLLDLAPVRALARSAPVRAIAESILGPQCVAVRGILFDKTPDANWKVIWHQDLTIAVRDHVDVAGYGLWTEKDGVPHVQPPQGVLERMLAVRVHLDDCGQHNGPVRVIPGSHLGGRLSSEQIDLWKASTEPVDCIVKPGGILAFYPLTLHASSQATNPGHRRVVHLEFAATHPGDGLTWYHEV
jgi:ectoine hydroxylase-related dioxygenase (phytanoyl-CoA dioxygenase family)